MVNIRWNSFRTPAVREKMVDIKELIEGRGREGELIEVDDSKNPHHRKESKRKRTHRSGWHK
jgi:hypothetical protein